MNDITIQFLNWMVAGGLVSITFMSIINSIKTHNTLVHYANIFHGWADRKNIKTHEDLVEFIHLKSEFFGELLSCSLCTYAWASLIMCTIVCYPSILNLVGVWVFGLGISAILERNSTIWK
jgi:hypothetical protein